MANGITSFGTATTSSGSDISAIGNVGYPEGSNMIIVSSADEYDYTINFKNTQKVAISVFIWNKAASQNGGAALANLGSCIAPTTPALVVNLAAGAEKIVAFMEDSQIGFAEATEKIAMSGAFQTTWAEVNFKKAGSGFDVSAIMNTAGNNYDMTLTAADLACISDMTQNMWIGKDNNPEDPVPVGNSDGSCYAPGSTLKLTAKMGGTV